MHYNIKHLAWWINVLTLIGSKGAPTPPVVGEYLEMGALNPNYNLLDGTSYNLL